MPQVATVVRVLVRNVQSDRESLTFSSFSLRELDASNFQTARQSFPGAMQREWLLERHYDAIPPLPAIAEGWPSPFGGIPFDVEDTLLLLRLYRPGDLAFVGMHIQTPTSSDGQYPYRAISPLVTTSTRPFQFTQTDCIEWERFAEPLKAASQWGSSWFRVVRRCLLYAGGKEFNPNFQDNIDRVIDYITALEATLVPKSKFLSLCMKERAVKLLGLSGQEAEETKQLLGEMYDIRSTLVHGSPVKPSQMAFLQDSSQWDNCEQLVRRILVAALRAVPSDESARLEYLKQLFNPAHRPVVVHKT
jgi:Apea-like HEPN